MTITPERLKRLETVASRRQSDLTVILENVHDAHNIGAVMRTCDSVGINEIYILYTDERLIQRGLEIGEKSASGSQQWLQIHYYTKVEECFLAVRQRYGRILGTMLSETATSLYELDLLSSVALLFGNEKDGISGVANRFIDGNFIIPQMGFAQSLNISVACAVSLYECFRQRYDAGFYDPVEMSETSRQLYLDYIRIHMEKMKKKRRH